MIRDISLISHLPAYLQEYRELQGITNAENPEFQSVCDDSEIVKDNMFVLHTNESGIARFEKMFGIQPVKNDHLENRQAKVLERCTNTVVYTMRGFIERLDTILGVGNYNVEFVPEEYRINVVLDFKVSRMVTTIGSMMEDMIPANMVCTYNINHNTHEMLSKHLNQKLMQFTHHQLKDEAIEYWEGE